MRPILTLALLFSVATAWAGPKAPAADDEKKTAAKRFFDTGTLLYERGEFVEAAKNFERAYAEAPFPAFLYNIATSYDKAGDRARAVENYRKYATAMPDAKDNAVAKARADVLEREWKELEAAKAANAKPAPPPPPKRVMPPPLPFAEPVTKYSYKTVVEVEGVPYTLIGAGARKVYGYKVYSMGLYLEDEPARAAFPRLAAEAGGSDHDSLARGDLAHQFVVGGNFGKAALLHFVRNVSGKDTRDSYREALDAEGYKTASPELKQQAEQFLAMFDDIKEGEDLWIRTNADGQVIVEARGQKKLGPKNLRLARDIWDIWLGLKPISSDLKKGMLDRIDTLGR